MAKAGAKHACTKKKVCGVVVLLTLTAAFNGIGALIDLSHEKINPAFKFITAGITLALLVVGVCFYLYDHFLRELSEKIDADDPSVSQDYVSNIVVR